jgi:hypothetical protein
MPRSYASTSSVLANTPQSEIPRKVEIQCHGELQPRQPPGRFHSTAAWDDFSDGWATSSSAYAIFRPHNGVTSYSTTTTRWLAFILVEISMLNLGVGLLILPEPPVQRPRLWRTVRADFWIYFRFYVDFVVSYSYSPIRANLYTEEFLCCIIPNPNQKLPMAILGFSSLKYGPFQVYFSWYVSLPIVLTIPQILTTWSSKFTGKVGWE